MHTYILLGLCVGLVVGLTGVGGGSLMTPFLILYGVPAPVAVGTDLLFAAVTKFGGAWAHHRAGSVRWRVVGLLAAGSLPASLAAAGLLRHVALGGGDYTALLRHFISASLVLTALVLLARERLQAMVWSGKFKRLNALRERHPVPLTVVAGICLGLLVTYSSVGAGALGTAALMILYPGIPTVSIVATDLAHAVALTAVASLGYLQLGFVDPDLLLLLMVGSIPGILLGTRISHRLPDAVLRRILGSMLFIIGVVLAI